MVLSSPGWLITLVMVEMEPGKVRVTNSVTVELPPGKVTVDPGRRLVTVAVWTIEWLKPEAVKKLVKVAPGKVRVKVIVAGGVTEPTGTVQDGVAPVRKLVKVAPGRVRVRVRVAAGVAGPTGTVHEETVTVWMLLSVAVKVSPSSVEIEVS